MIIWFFTTKSNIMLSIPKKSCPFALIGKSASAAKQTYDKLIKQAEKLNQNLENRNDRLENLLESLTHDLERCLFKRVNPKNPYEFIEIEPRRMKKFIYDNLDQAKAENLYKFYKYVRRLRSNIEILTEKVEHAYLAAATYSIIAENPSLTYEKALETAKFERVLALHRFYNPL